MIGGVLWSPDPVEVWGEDWRAAAKTIKKKSVHQAKRLIKWEGARRKKLHTQISKGDLEVPIYPSTFIGIDKGILHVNIGSRQDFLQDALRFRRDIPRIPLFLPTKLSGSQVLSLADMYRATLIPSYLDPLITPRTIVFRIGSNNKELQMITRPQIELALGTRL